MRGAPWPGLRTRYDHVRNSRATDFYAITPVVWEFGPSGSARKPVRLIADESLLEIVRDATLLQQLKNVAALPGIVEAVWATPNAHAATAFPVGCVAASDPDAGGVVTPMGVGSDPFCGVRLMTLDLDPAAIRPKLGNVLTALARTIPTGPRHGARHGSLSVQRAMLDGTAWAVEQGFGFPEDVAVLESAGHLIGADPDVISSNAKALGEEQLGSLGDGHHFIEFGCIDALYDQRAAQTFGLAPGQIVVLIQAGSRGLGRQVLGEYQRTMSRAAARHLINLPDRQLYCAPVHSHEGRDYLAAMASVANFAFANRQVLAHRVAHAIQTLLGTPGDHPAVRTVFEQCHNTIALEIHSVKGSRKRLCVHRRGASRVRPPGHDDIPLAYRAVGQPVFLPGHYTSGSFVCVSRAEAGDLAFASVPAHTGAHVGRRSAREMLMMRKADDPGDVIVHGSRGIGERNHSGRNIEKILEVTEAAGLIQRVAHISPLAVFRA